MADYNLKGDTLVQGINCIVRIGSDPASAKKVGLVQDCSFRKQIQTQRAEVIGEILPVSIDPTGISVSVSFRGFIPKKGVNLGDFYTAKELNPNDDDIIDNQKVVKIPYLELYDKKAGAVIGSTTWAIMTSYEESTSGKGYTVANCSFEAIGFFNGSDYPTSELFAQ